MVGTAFFLVPVFVFAQESTTPTSTIPQIPEIVIPTQAEIDAQVADIVGSELQLETRPIHPRPNEVTTVRAKSFALNLNQAILTWRVDGEVVASGASITEIQLETGAVGSQRIIVVEALAGGLVTQAQLTVRPATVDLLWEAQSYTPPLYRGKALAGPETPLRIVAIPQVVSAFGEPIAPSDLVFTWEHNGRVLGTQSGRGKNTLEHTSTRLFNEDRYTLTAHAATDESLSARGFLTIEPTRPHILFYENDPVLGLRYEKNIGDTFMLENEEIVVVAHPFFFSGTSRIDASNSFEWTINGAAIDNPLADQSSIVLRRTGSGSGTATINLSIQNVDEVLQRAEEQFRIMFGEGTDSNVF